MTERACLPEPPLDVLDRHRFAGLRLPIVGEGLVEILVEFARRVVADIGDGDIG